MDERWNCWLNDIRYNSDGLMEYLLENPPEATYGLARMLVSDFEHDPEAQLSEKRGLLVSGKAGTGKHAAAYHVAKVLAEREHKVLFLNGSDFGFACEDAETVQDYLQGLLQTYSEEQKPLCVVLDQPELSPCCGTLLEELGNIICGENRSMDMPKLYLIVITEHAEIVPALLREQLRHCHLALPDMEARRQYLQENGSSMMGLRFEADAGFYQVLAAETEGMNYPALRGILEKADMLVSLDGIHSQELLVMIRPRRMQAAGEMENMTEGALEEA